MIIRLASAIGASRQIIGLVVIFFAHAADLSILKLAQGLDETP
jgi:hypothetical protein